MNTVYPPMVEKVKTTNGELLSIHQIDDYGRMSDRPDYSAIGERIAAIRKGFSDLSQSAWAEKHHFGVTQYNNWEKGTRRISVDAAEILVEKYGLTLDYIFRGRRDGLSEYASNVL